MRWWYRRSWVLSFILVIGLSTSAAAGIPLADAEDPIGTQATAGSADAHDWPDIDQALIRPGIQIGPSPYCSTNFVFTDDDGGIYLGTASHCAMEVGDRVTLQQDPDYFTGDPGPEIGYVHYSSRVVENVQSEPCYVIFSCGGGDGNPRNDFALIKIHEYWHDKVHPAVRHVGGPVALLSLDELAVSDPILTVGNSPLRPGPTPLDARHGAVMCITEPWWVSASFLTPALPGDSGSLALSEDGRALGIVNTIEVITECPGRNGITVLETALEYAASYGVHVQLATWDVYTLGLPVHP